MSFYDDLDVINGKLLICFEFFWKSIYPVLFFLKIKKEKKDVTHLFSFKLKKSFIKVD